MAAKLAPPGAAGGGGGGGDPPTSASSTPSTLGSVSSEDEEDDDEARGGRGEDDEEEEERPLLLQHGRRVVTEPHSYAPHHQHKYLSNNTNGGVLSAMGGSAARRVPAEFADVPLQAKTFVTTEDEEEEEANSSSSAARQRLLRSRRKKKPRSVTGNGKAVLPADSYDGGGGGGTFDAPAPTEYALQGDKQLTPAGFRVSLMESGGLASTSVRRLAAGRYPREALKLAVATCFMLLCMFTTALALAFVHEKRPLTKRLPDQVLDHVVYQRWGLAACEHLIQFQVATTLCVIGFHRHRFILARRVFLMVGVLYLYRALTMWVTALPVADESYHCAPKLGRDLRLDEAMGRAVQIMLGMGLSINGMHVYCGDYIFSGHTMSMILAQLIVKEYTPRTWFPLHWVTWVVTYTSIVLLLISHGHYTIDVVVAYFITTRVWATYHTVANHLELQQRTASNHFSTLWWFEPVRWFEENVKPGPLPNEYNLPVPKRVQKFARKHLDPRRWLRGGSGRTWRRRFEGKRTRLREKPNDFNA